jgi:hypothetical protein
MITTYELWREVEGSAPVPYVKSERSNQINSNVDMLFKQHLGWGLFMRNVDKQTLTG